MGSCLITKTSKWGKEDPGAVVLVVDNMWKEECDFNAKPGLRRAEFSSFTFPDFTANAFNSNGKLALNRVNFSFLTWVKRAERSLLCHLKIVWDPRVRSVQLFFCHFGAVYCRANWVLFDIAWYFAVLGQLAG